MKTLLCATLVLGSAACSSSFNPENCTVVCATADQSCPAGLLCSNGRCATPGNVCAIDDAAPRPDTTSTIDGSPIDAVVAVIDANHPMADASSAIDAKRSDASSAPITLFAPTSIHQGDLGGRSGADAICSQSVGELSCQNGVHALLSVTADDDMANMPTTFGISSIAPIVGPTGIAIASNWNSLMTMPLANSLLTAGVLMTGEANWWSGNAVNGSLGDNCIGWTSASSDDLGTLGARDATDSTWSADGNSICFGNTTVVCVCY